MTAVTAERGTIPVLRVVRAAWFRNRLTLIGLLALFAAVAGWTLYQAMSMRSWLIAHHALACTADPNRCVSKNSAWEQFSGYFHPDLVLYALLVLPAVAAMFGGVRWLTREYEMGTFRYTWSQGVSRLRWLAGTLLPLLALTIVGGVACGLAFDRWFPMGQWIIGADTTGATWDWHGFALTPVTFPALLLAAFGVAVLAAALIRRIVPAMAVTLGACAALIYLSDTYLRSWLIGLHPVIARAQFSGGFPMVNGAYVVRGWFTDGGGHIVPGISVTSDGALNITSFSSMTTVLMNGSATSERRWLAAHHYTYWLSYQPHDRILLFHALWAGVLLVIGAASLGVAMWRVAVSR
jgi:hypothetical protein